MRKPTKKTVVIAAAMALLVGGGGVAYGYWTNTGSGSATSTTAAGLATLTTTQQGSITGMAPGSAVQDVDFTIVNSASALTGADPAAELQRVRRGSPWP